MLCIICILYYLLHLSLQSIICVLSFFTRETLSNILERRRGIWEKFRLQSQCGERCSPEIVEQTEISTFLAASAIGLLLYQFVHSSLTPRRPHDVGPIAH